jgi:hypothetical protein
MKTYPKKYRPKINFVKSIPGLGRFRAVPEVDGQHQEQVMGQDLGPHPDVVVIACEQK